MEVDLHDLNTLSPLLEAMPDALVIVDRNGLIQVTNKQTEIMFGYERKEIIGKSVEFLMPEKYRNIHIKHRATYFEAPRARPMGLNNDLYGLRKNGEKFPVEISLSSLKIKDQLIAMAAVRDVTDRKLLEEKLRFNNEELMIKNEQILEATRMKSEFLANMSHELRTPLNGIIGFAELMHTGAVGAISEEHKEYLGDILKSSQHLLRLINDVLDLSKVESGKFEFSPEEIEMSALINEVCDILRTLINKNKMRVIVDISPKLEKAFIDSGKLKQILYNFLSNAIKFSPIDSTIRIMVEKESEKNFRLSVIDSGIGISDKDQQKLFTEFQQLDYGTSKKYQGTGLGLALSKRIAEAQGGSIGVISRPNKGSTFYVILPLRATIK